MHILDCHADLQEAKTNLRKYLGQLVYLQNLGKVSSLSLPLPTSISHDTSFLLIDSRAERGEHWSMPHLYWEAW